MRVGWYWLYHARNHYDDRLHAIISPRGWLQDFPSTALTFEAWISTSDFCHAGVIECDRAVWQRDTRGASCHCDYAACNAIGARMRSGQSHRRLSVCSCFAAPHRYTERTEQAVAVPIPLHAQPTYARLTFQLVTVGAEGGRMEGGGGASGAHGTPTRQHTCMNV